MIASDVDFDFIKRHSLVNRELGEVFSFIQVEYGIKDLEACWEGFSDTSDNAGLEFDGVYDLGEKLYHALLEYVNFIRGEDS
jgi:hypothetical protein